jgi:hypothetical protein
VAEAITNTLFVIAALAWLWLTWAIVQMTRRSQRLRQEKIESLAKCFDKELSTALAQAKRSYDEPQ